MAAIVDRYDVLQLFAQFFDDLFGFIRGQIARQLEVREAGAVLSRLAIMRTPIPRFDGHPDYDNLSGDPANPLLVITRAALFIPFLAEVRSPSQGLELVQGALTSVVGNVNQPANRVKQTWMDIDDLGLNRLMKPDENQYQVRMLSVGAWIPSDYPPGSPEREQAS